MEFKLKWSIDGETRYYLGLARGMGLARQGVIYTHIYTHFYFPPKSKQARAFLPPFPLPLGYIKKREEEEISSSISHHPKILGKLPAPTQGL